MSNSRPLLVGITGGIGSGKSTVCKLFTLLGVPVYTADDRAKWLMSHDTTLKEKILAAFGAESYHSTGELNRGYLAETVFSNPEKVTSLNALVHPAVGKDFALWVSQQNAPYLIKEAALLFETGAAKELDFVINISSPLRVRMARVLLRDPQRTEEQVNQIINQQLRDEEKNELADFSIKNSDNKLLLPQVIALHEQLLNKAKMS